jgi:hypothetical protein
MSENANIKNSIALFFHEHSQKFEFPSGKSVPIFNDEERELLRSIAGCSNDTIAIAALFGDTLTRSNCYAISILGVRKAIQALRTNNSQDLSLVGSLIAVGSQKMDWRDRLRVFAILIECCNRLGADGSAIAIPALRAIDESIAQEFIGFVELPPVQRRFAKLMIQEVQLPEGVSFVSS